ncbi:MULTISPECIES: tripartite tricarboxylate transporter substrate binding protein [unclassified Rhizobacter]|uniref:Bug family tripartite tricarboxylate transporter substrate binding protein n=1 Tax=unclassified Rhizobacter TaxID=2640088 RepID=UPI0006FC10D0|nr:MULTISPECIES: tripartite tricarboxylate transporter substrate binding protein [unclassified Rhizobacter]KQU80423.1 ABC transporter substrate-binding protein [Rhizobacter sp. Root29]KQW13920.1 ABC transporter substrate-binding protein [Rhizobacter sp. Root1238]KRB15745.1 ABC transporter substrate-binding protein [Rhizobacter sp. Root16D2]
MQRRHLLSLAGAAALPALSTLASAQGSKPIRLVVPYSPGGPLDVIARALADKVKDSLGLVIVDNKAGAGGNIGADAVAKSAPDGLTIVMGAVATHAINPWLYARIPYDPIRDFTPITGVAQVPNVLVMNTETAARLGIRNVADLVAYAKKNPGKLNYGSGGNGSAGHLAGEMFKAQAGVFMVHIPYSGGNPAQLALLSGQVDLNFDNLATASTNIKAGKLRALAVTTTTRSSAMPEVPTIAEAGGGLARFDVNTWFGLFGPAGLSADVTRKLNKAFTDALATPDIKARFATLMAEPIPSTPEQFAAFVKRERAKYETVVKQSGAKVD